MRRARLIPIALCFASRLAAQWQATADFGISQLRQPGFADASALMAGASVDALSDRAQLRSRMLGARDGTGGWTAQGVVLGSLFGPPTAGVRWELTGIGAAFGQTSQSTNIAGEAMARAHVGSPSLGFALGAGAGLLGQGVIDRALYHGQLSAWRTGLRDQSVVDISFVGTSARSSDALPGSAPRYADASLAWHRDIGGLELDAGAGARAGFRAASGGAWALGSATAWLGSNFGIVAGAGRTLDDVLRGVPRTEYVNIGVRIAARPRAAVLGDHSSVDHPVAFLSRDALEIRARGATRVEVMADFTDWTIVALEPHGNTWRLPRAVSPGLHRLAVRIDGGDWMAPSNLPRVTDDLGGSVGVVTVP